MTKEDILKQAKDFIKKHNISKWQAYEAFKSQYSDLISQTVKNSSEFEKLYNEFMQELIIILKL